MDEQDITPTPAPPPQPTLQQLAALFASVLTGTLADLDKRLKALEKPSGH